MEFIGNISSFKSLPTRRPVRNTHDNDNALPPGATPMALPGPLPESIVFPKRVVRGSIR